jgi:hypothetical protein
MRRIVVRRGQQIKSAFAIQIVGQAAPCGRSLAAVATDYEARLRAFLFSRLMKLAA